MACHSNVIFMCVGRPFSGLHHFHTIINLSFLPRCIYLLFVRPFLSLCRSLSLRTPKTWKSNFDFVLGATHIGAHILLSILFDTTDNCGDTTNQSDEPIQRYIPMHSTKVFETFDSANWIDNVSVFGVWCVFEHRKVYFLTSAPTTYKYFRYFHHTVIGNPHKLLSIQMDFEEQRISSNSWTQVSLSRGYAVPITVPSIPANSLPFAMHSNSTEWVGAR